MGCCFSKEAGPDQNSEKSSLLHTPHQDRIQNSVEQVRHQAVAVAQHVSLDEEEEAGAARAEARPGLDCQARMVVSEKTVQAPSSHKEERAILIPAGASVIPDSSAGVTLSHSRDGEPAPYMEVLSQSLTRQNIVANATRRAQWFTQNLEGQKLLHPEDSRSGSSGTGGDSCSKVPRDLTLSSVSHQDRVSLIGEDCIVTTTLGQDFQTRTQKFYSICSIDTNDLDHDDHRQARVSETCAGSSPSQTASPLLNQPLNPAPLTGASGIIPELQVDPNMPRGMPEGNDPSKAEGDSCVQTCDQLMLTEQCVYSIQRQSPKEVRSFPEPDVPEQQTEEEDQSSLQREDGVPANKSEEDEVMHKNATLTQLTSPPLFLTSVVELKTPGLDDEDDLGDQTRLTEKEPSMSRTSKETPAILRENQVDHVQHSHPAIYSPKDFHSCPEPDITEPQIEGEDKSSLRREDDVPESESVLSTSDVECLGLTDEEDSCDRMTLREQSVSPELQTSQEKNATFQENHLDHIQHSQQAGENLQEVPRSRLSCSPESNVMEQHDEGQEDAPERKNEEDEVIHSNLTHTQVSFPSILSTSPHQCDDGEGTGRDNEDMSAKVSLAAFSEQDANSTRSHESDSKAVQTNLNCLHSRSSSVEKISGNRLESSREVCEEEEETAEYPSDPPEPINGSLRDEEETVPLAQEEHPKTPPRASSDAEMINVCRPDEVSCHLQDLGVQVEFDQLDVHALTPSYEIHFLGPETPGEEGESGMRELVSELLGGDADVVSVCHVDHQTWIGPAVEDRCQAWLQGAPQSPELQQPGAVLLGAFPCEWAWHTGCPDATLNPDAEVWTGSNYNLPWLHLPNEQVDLQNHALHAELADIGVGVAEVEAQPIATENHILPEPDSGELMDQLRSTLDYCLSREYLASDLYLQSRMDDDQYVPIAALAGLHAIKSLGADLQLVTDVIKTVPQVQMSACGHKVRANHSRYVLILREIPSSTPREEVEALFSDKKLPKFLSCEVVSGDYWFVTFGSEADAYQAYVYLREEVRVFQGKPIKVRMKAKSTTPTSHIPGNGFCPNAEPSYLPPDAYQQLYDFTYPVWSDSGYSDNAEQPLELSGALNGLQAAPYFQHHAARRKRNGARTSGWYQISRQTNSDDPAAKSSVETSTASRPARGWSHSRGNRPRHNRCYDRLTGAEGGRSVNDDQRRRKKLWSALKTAGVQHTKPSTPRQSSPIQLGASDFPPLGVEKTPEPAQPLTPAADDIAHEATQKLSYAAICQKSSSGRPAPPVEEK